MPRRLLELTLPPTRCTKCVVVNVLLSSDGRWQVDGRELPWLAREHEARPGVGTLTVLYIGPLALLIGVGT